MGLAAALVGVLLAFTLAVAIIYGTVVGLVRLGRFTWRLLAPEAATEAAGAVDESPLSVPCWLAKECPPTVREACPAYIQREEGMPCWLANLRAEGRLRVICLTCSRFSVAELVA